MTWMTSYGEARQTRESQPTQSQGLTRLTDRRNVRSCYTERPKNNSERRVNQHHKRGWGPLYRLNGTETQDREASRVTTLRVDEGSAIADSKQRR